MSTYYFFSSLFILLLLSACAQSVDNSLSSNSEESVVNDVTSSSADIKDTFIMPELEIEFVIAENQQDIRQEVTALIIKNISGNEKFQSIEGLSYELEEGHPAYEKLLNKDLNFDGYKDLIFPKSFGNANIFYDYWLFNPETKLFEKNEEMILSLPSVNIDDKQVISYERGSAADYFETFYEFRSNKFVLVKTQEKHYSAENKYQVIVSELQTDGTMLEVRKEEVTE